MVPTPMTSQEFLSIDEQKGTKMMHLNEDIVRSYLLSDEVADKPVVVISVAGAFRTGKSFLLNSMTRYLKAEDKSCWLDAKSESFPWKSGCNAHTKGMSMAHPIPVTLQTGEEVVLLLIDTQGIFDVKSKAADSTRIFALSTLLSSLQIFNMMNNLKSDDLDHLTLFAEYGRLVKDNADGKPFQDLIFLIRDWYHTGDHAFGVQGGNDLVKQRLNSDKESFQKRGELVESCFTNVGGFLLPAPGKVVAGSVTFDGDAADMEPEFVTALEDLMSTLLSPEKLSVKMNGSRPVTCRQMVELIKIYTNLFQSEELPEPASMLQVVAEAGNMAAVNHELLTYTRRMERLLGEDAPMLHEELLHDEQAQAKTDALESLKLQRTMRDPTKPEDYYTNLLSKKIGDWFQTSETMFREKCKRDKQQAMEANKRLVDDCVSLFGKSMDYVQSDKPVGHEKIRQAYEQARAEAFRRFDGELVTFGPYSGKESRSLLDRTLEKELARIQERDEENANTIHVQNEFLRYETRMSGLLKEDAQKLDEGLLFQEQTKSKAEALEALKPKLTMVYSTRPENWYSSLLADKIENWFQKSELILKKKCERDKQKAIEGNERLVDECISTFEVAMSSVKLDQPTGEKKIVQTYAGAEKVAVKRFNGEVVTFGSYTAEESRLRLEKAMQEKLRMILERDEETANKAAKDNEFLRYKKWLEGMLAGDAMLDEGLVIGEHSKAKARALAALKPQLTMKNSTKREEYYSGLLVSSIEDYYLKTQNLLKEKCKQDRLNANRANERLLQECLTFFDKSTASVNSVHANDDRKIRDLYAAAERKALTLFAEKKVTFGSYTGEDYQSRLTEKIQLRRGKALERNSDIHKNMEIVEHQANVYVKQMNTLLGESATMLDESILCSKHAQAREGVLESLTICQTKGDQTIPENHYSCLLVDKIETWFNNSKQKFIEKCRHDKLRADEANEKLVQECSSSFESSLDEVPIEHREDDTKVAEAYEEGQKTALQLFDSKMVSFGSYSAKEYRTKLEGSFSDIYVAWLADDKGRRRNAKYYTAFKVAAATVGVLGALAAGPGGWVALATVGSEAALVAGGVAVAATATSLGLRAMGNAYETKAGDACKKKKKNATDTTGK